MMTIAEVLNRESFVVDVLMDRHLNLLGGMELKKKLSKRFDLDLKKVNFILAPIGEGSTSFSRRSFLKKYDVLFYLTDGSIFIPGAKRNILHIQSPLVGQPAKSLWGNFKLKFWSLIIYNSQFTKKYSEKNWPLSSLVIYPPVDTDKINPLKKEKYILSVGRFFGYLKDKKHEVMIKAFKELIVTNKINDWSLNLAGSAQGGDNSYLKQLRRLAKDLPVNFYPNLQYDDLIKMYGQSSIYWHAAGFEEEDPTKMEHFGISTVEAMAAGCIPVVIGKGGQVEIIEHSKNGFLWESVEELKDHTLKLINDQSLRSKISDQAIKRAKDFSKEKFELKIKETINK